jgi:hypothetical protein
MFLVSTSIARLAFLGHCLRISCPSERDRAGSGPGSRAFWLRVCAAKGAAPHFWALRKLAGHRRIEQDGVRAGIQEADL